MSRTGCLGRLFWLPAALLGGGRQRAALPQRGLTPAEREALLGARRTAESISKRLLAAGRSVSPLVLDQIGGSTSGLAEAIDQMGLQLAETRAWIARNDPDQLNRQLTELELESGPGVADRARTMRLLREKSRKASQIRAELPAMSARMIAMSAELGGLDARLTLDSLREDTEKTTAAAARQREEAERSLAAWADTVQELRALS